MKNLIPITLISVLFLSACSATYQGSALYDDVYYGATEVAPVSNMEYARPEYIETDYVYEGDEYIEESNYQDSLRPDIREGVNYDDENYYEYMNAEPYAARIMRFSGPSWRWKYAYNYYDQFYMNDYYSHFGSHNYIMGWPYNYGYSSYVGLPLSYIYDWGWDLGYGGYGYGGYGYGGFGLNFGFGWNSYNGFSLGFGLGFGGFGYGGYGYGGYGYGGYGNWGYPYYGQGSFGHNAFRDVQYGHRNTRGQINSNRSILTPRNARGFISKTKSLNSEARSARGSRSTLTQQSGSVSLVGELQKPGNKTTSTRTRSIINGKNTKAANQNSREQRINSNRQRYTRTTPKYNKPGVYRSKSRTATNSRQYTSPQRNSRNSQKYSTRVKNTNQSIRRIIKPSTRTQRYSSPTRSTRNLKSSGSKSSTRSYSTKYRTTKSKSSRSYSSGSRSSSSGSRSSSSSSRSSSSSSRSGRKR